jgi:hypothetical protein
MSIAAFVVVDDHSEECMGPELYSGFSIFSHHCIVNGDRRGASEAFIEKYFSGAPLKSLLRP